MKPNTPFAFLKNNLLPPAGAALEQYYLPILETDTVAVYRYLLALMIRVKNNIYWRKSSII